MTHFDTSQVVHWSITYTIYIIGTTEAVGRCGIRYTTFLTLGSAIPLSITYFCSKIVCYTVTLSQNRQASVAIHAYMELGVIGGLITPVCSLMLSLSLPNYQVRLDWLPWFAMIQPSQLSCLSSPVGRASAS